VSSSTEPPNQPSTADSREQARQYLQAGKLAFERGDYRQSVQQLEQAKALVNPATRFGGEIQIWLVTAYEAAGEQSQALDLCRLLVRHADYQTRKQGKRLLYILEAPKLKMRPEWLTEIPDLSNLSENDQAGIATSRYTNAKPRRPAEPKPFTLPEPPDPNLVNTRDNQFVWVALGLVALILSGLFWLSQT